MRSTSKARLTGVLKRLLGRLLSGPYGLYRLWVRRNDCPGAADDYILSCVGDTGHAMQFSTSGGESELEGVRAADSEGGRPGL